MDFNSNKAIYLQIAEYVCEHILLDNWKAGERVPSVRELAVKLEVNPNTVARTYELLQQHEIIQNKRGVGFFITQESMKQVKEYKRNIFLEEELPELFRNIYLLNIHFDSLEDLYKQYIDNHFKTNNDEEKQ